MEQALRALEVGDRVGVREESGRGVGGEHEKRQRLLPEAGLKEVVGDDPRVLLGFTETLGQELPHHGVVLDPQFRRDAGVEDLANLGVVEVVLRARGADQVVDLLEELQGLQ